MLRKYPISTQIRRNKRQLALALIAGFVASLCAGLVPVWADIGASGGGTGGGAALDGTVVISNTGDSSTERALAVEASLTKTDGGPNSTVTIGTGSVLDYYHSTGATTQQTAINAILDATGATEGDIIYFNGTNWTKLARGSNGEFLKSTASTVEWGTPGGGGTVTSVGLTVPDWLAVANSPVTGSDTLAVTEGTGLSNYYVVCTNGSGALDLQALTADHIPNLAASKITSGTLAETVGGTGQSTYTLGDLLYADATNSIDKLTGNTTTTKQFLTQTGDGANSAAPAWGTIAAADVPSLAASKITSGTFPIAQGGTNNGSLDVTAANIMITDGSKITHLAKGTGNQVVGMNSGATAQEYKSVVAGTGITVNHTSGQIEIVNSASTSGASMLRAEDITTTLESLPTTGNWDKPVYIHNGNWTSTGNITITVPIVRVYLKGNFQLDHTITATASTAVNNGGKATGEGNAGNGGGFNGSGGAGGMIDGANSSEGGGGGGNGGAGGDGGSYGQGTQPGGRAVTELVLVPGGGGGGGAGYTSGTDVPGGAGGAALYLEVYGNIDINDDITLDGQAGTAATSASFCGGSGAGAGGTCITVCSGTWDLASGKTISTDGANGGAQYSTYGDGAGGGGGRQYHRAGGVLSNNGTLSVSAGSSGTGTPSYPATNGSAGVSETFSETTVYTLF